MTLLLSYCTMKRFTWCFVWRLSTLPLKPQKNVDWESCYMKAADILKEFLEQYVDRGEANKVGNVFAHSKESVNKSILSTPSSRANAVHVHHCCCFTCPTGFHWCFKKGYVIILYVGVKKAELIRSRGPIGQKYAFREISVRTNTTGHVGCLLVDCWCRMRNSSDEI